MNRNLNPDEFGDLFDPDAADLDYAADIEARGRAGLPGIYEGIAGSQREADSIADIFEDEPVWRPPPGRLN